MAAPVRDVPPPKPASAESDAAVMFGLLEERFTELSKRIASLEQGSAPAAGAAPAGLDPFMKRLQEVEEEITKVKLFLVDAPAAPAQGSQDISAIARKVETLQKILESLTSDTEVAKPS